MLKADCEKNRSILREIKIPDVSEAWSHSAYNLLLIVTFVAGLNSAYVTE
jgi:hypothetical protein